MSEETPELGSTISLISKAGIRYEGRLFTVDPKECTIALAGVRSFGTEDRIVEQRVPPQNNVYDYILFRGSDIKDIVTLNGPAIYPNNDPAIMQFSVPPPMQKQFQPHYPAMGHMEPHMSQFAPTVYGMMGPMSACVAPGMGPMGHDPRSFPKPNILAARSRSTTPASLISGKSSTNDQGIQVGANKRDDKKVVQPIQPPGQRGQPQRDRRDSRENQGYFQDMQRRPFSQNRYQNQSNQPQQRQGGWVQRGQVRQRGRPRGTGYKMNPAQPAQAGAKPKIKFDQEFDFEQANTEFEELKNKYLVALNNQEWEEN